MFSSISVKVWQGLCALLFFLVLTFGGLYLKEQSNAADARTALATEKQKRSDEVAVQAAVAASAVADARDEERRMAEVREKAIRDEQQQALDQAADLRRSLATEQRLRQRTATLAAAASCGARPADPASAPGSPTAQQALDLLADMPSRLAAAGGDIAGFADLAYARAATCEAIADSHVTP